MKKIHLSINIFLFFMIVLGHTPSKSQSYSITKEVNWAKNTPSTRFSLFENVCFFEDTLTPYYHFTLELNSKSNLAIQIKETKTETLSEKKLLNFINTKKLNPSPDIEYNVFTSRKTPSAHIYICPLIKTSNGQIKKITEFTLKVTEKASLKTTKSRSYKSSSVLRSGNWIKISLTKNGIYKITYDQITDWGLSNPENIRVYGNGGKMLPFKNSSYRPDDLLLNPIKLEKGSDGVFNSGDYILFFGHKAEYWEYDDSDEIFVPNRNLYTDTSYYFITTSLDVSPEINEINNNSLSSSQTLTTYTSFGYHESDSVSIIKSGRNFYGEIINNLSTDVSFDFLFPNRMVSKPIKLYLGVGTAGITGESYIYYLIANNNQIGTIAASTSLPEYKKIDPKNAVFSFTSENQDLEITTRFNSNSSYLTGYIDNIYMNCTSNLIYDGDSYLFRNNIDDGTIVKYTIESDQSINIWDISNISSVKEIKTTLNNNQYSFNYVLDTIKEFIVFNDEDYLTPNYCGEVANQNLHGLGYYDMIIITHPDFIDEAKELASFRKENDGITSVVVPIQKIYNEFSSGGPDVSAYRDFMKLFYDKATSSEQIPKYLLLFGDGSYDNKNYNSQNTNFILTAQSTNSYHGASSYVSDDYFGLLDEDEGEIDNIFTGDLDIGIGRLPVKTAQEAQNVLNKIESYSSDDTYGDWRNYITFLADDADDALTHMQNAVDLSNIVANKYPYFNIDKILLDAYEQVIGTTGESYPDAKEALNSRINKGTLILNYSGHGGVQALADERIVTISDITSWSNSDALCLFITATCEFSRYDDYEFTSAGERILLTPNGGGIALITTTRVVYSSGNYTLNSYIYKYLFSNEFKQKNYRLGDLIRLAKNATGSDTETNKRNFSLLGDPSQNINLPEKLVATSKINNENTVETNKKNTELKSKFIEYELIEDTVKALSKMRVYGYVTDTSYNIINDETGVITITVYDKEKSITTKDNDGTGTLTFNLRSNIIYKGKASVTKGYFKTEFIVPKDISYNYDIGRISYYYKGDDFDATGFFENFIIGGISDTVINDNTGPEINLYMNDTSFVYGGITDPDPNIYAKLTDSSGINTVGNGIGHDITATLDENSSDVYTLNDYYEAEIDSYQKGVVNYPLSDLEEGEHNIKLKVWDINNNSSEEYIEFYVTSDDEIEIEHLVNYPNPFTTSTDFYFDHNQPNKTLDVFIQIFTISGKLVKSINTSFSTTGFLSQPIHWDGTDEYGDRIGRGAYIYRLKIKTDDGKTAEKFEKLVILK